MNLPITLIERPGFVRTRARLTDGETSHEAAHAAASRKAAEERRSIYACIAKHGGKTAMEVSTLTDIDYIEVQRRISECGLTKTAVKRDGRYVWEAV